LERIWERRRLTGGGTSASHLTDLYVNASSRFQLHEPFLCARPLSRSSQVIKSTIEPVQRRIWVDTSPAALNLANAESDDDDSDDEKEDPMASLPPYVVERVETLKELNEQRDKIMEQYLEERAALEAKYHFLCEPLYAECANVVKGLCDEEIAKKAAEKRKACQKNRFMSLLKGRPKL